MLSPIGRPLGVPMGIAGSKAKGARPTPRDILLADYTFTSGSGTVVAPDEALYAIEEAWGAGGGGGFNGTGGGSGGGYARRRREVNGGDVIPYKIGAGGAGGTGTTSAVDGEPSACGCTFAVGGVGAVALYASGLYPGANALMHGGVGDVLYKGGDGGDTQGTGGGAGGGAGAGGNGGNGSEGGSAGAGGAADSEGNGAGGSGGSAPGGGGRSQAFNGAPGADGKCRIRFYA